MVGVNDSVFLSIASTTKPSKLPFQPLSQNERWGEGIGRWQPRDGIFRKARRPVLAFVRTPSKVIQQTLFPPIGSRSYGQSGKGPHRRRRTACIVRSRRARFGLG